MADLTDVEVFEPIYQLETTDQAMGGVGGVMNSQAQALANRTAWLNANKANLSDVYNQTEVDLIETGLQSSIDDNGIDIASNLAAIGVNAGTIVGHTSQISALTGRVNTAESDINTVESGIVGLDSRIDDLEEKTSWLTISGWSGTYSSFYGRIRQAGNVVTGSGYVVFSVAGYQDQSLMTFPTGITAPSINIYFNCSGFGESNPLYIVANQRVMKLNRSFAQQGQIQHFNFSYIV